MQVINVHDAKTNLSKLLERAANGERIIIGKAGKPMARLEPFSGTEAVHLVFKGGSLRVQAQSKLSLSPTEIKNLAKSKYDA